MTVPEDPAAPEPERRRPDARSRPQAVRAAVRPSSLGVAKLDQLPPARAARGRLGRPLQRRQVEPDQRADRPPQPGPDVQHAGPHAADQPLRPVGGRLMLVDLPGYGYAQAPKDLVERWTRLVFAYLRGRPSLLRVCLLIDARHGIKEADDEVLELLSQAAVPYPARADQGRPGAQARDLRGAAARARDPARQDRRRHAAARSPPARAARTGVDLLRAALAEARPPQRAVERRHDRCRRPRPRHRTRVAATLIEALPYMRRYQARRSSSSMAATPWATRASPRDFARDIVLLKQVGINPVVVHGGGPQIKAHAGPAEDQVARSSTGCG